MFRKLVLAALSIAAIASTAHAAVIGTMQNNGTTLIVTDDQSAPGPGYTLRGCGQSTTGKHMCTWGVSTSPAAPAAPAAPPPRVVPDVNVADQGNPLVGGVQPDAQAACQWSSNSARCVQVRPKTTIFDWVMGVGSLVILGEEASHGNGGFGCCSSSSGQTGGTWVNGSWIPNNAVFSRGGAPR